MVEIEKLEVTVPLMYGVFELLGDVGVEPVNTGAEGELEFLLVVES